MSLAAGSGRSLWRRLAVWLAVLAAADQAVLPLLKSMEPRRYESAELLRLENSDLFLLGPLTAYLRANPAGPKPRVIFLGDSVMWGYLLETDQSFPDRFQRLVPTVKVFNLSSNGLDAVSALLMTRALADSADAFCYLYQPDDLDRKPHPMLTRLIPVRPEDAVRFGLPRAPPWRAPLDRMAGLWKLARCSHRLQAAWFSNSTRQHLYSEARRLAKRLIGPLRRDDPAGAGRAAGLRVLWSCPSADGPLTEMEVQELARRHSLLWEYASLLASRRKRGVILLFAHRRSILSDRELGQLNRHFRPWVLFAKLTVPEGLLMADRNHLTAEGAEEVARTLAEHAPPIGAGSP